MLHNKNSRRDSSVWENGDGNSDFCHFHTKREKVMVDFYSTHTLDVTKVIIIPMCAPRDEKFIDVKDNPQNVTEVVDVYVDVSLH